MPVYFPYHTSICFTLLIWLSIMLQIMLGLGLTTVNFFDLKCQSGILHFRAYLTIVLSLISIEIYIDLKLIFYINYVDLTIQKFYLCNCLSKN